MHHGSLLTKGARVSRHPDLVTVEEHGTIYLVPLFHPAIRLNRTASEIWRLVQDGGNSVAQVCEKYAEIFECSDEQASTEVHGFVLLMLQSGNLIIAESVYD